MTYIPGHPAEWMYLFSQYVLVNARFSNLHSHFADVGLDWRAMTVQHERVMMDCKLNNDMDLKQQVVAAIAGYQRDVYKLPQCAVEGSEYNDVLQRTKALFDIGYNELPPISSNKIEQIVDYFEDQDLVPGTDPRSEDVISFAQAKQSLNVAYYSIDNVLVCPHVMDLANDPKILAIVEQYLGATPTLIFPAVWWSFARPEEAREAQLFHYDLDDHRFCKLFIYLTDVGMDSGPHVYVEKSHRMDIVNELRANSLYSEAEFDDWFFHAIRKTDDDVERYLGLPTKHFVGKSGSRFLVDTSGIHKGLLPSDRDRLLCQFTYGVMPRSLMPYKPMKIPSIGAGPISHKAVTTQPLSYVNRLFVTRAAV